jgi:serine/threonine protein kinase
MDHPDASRFARGDLICGRYRVEDEVGRGGMGVVLRARDTQLNRKVALKMLPEATTGDPGLRRRLAAEARAASGVSHSGIAAVFDFVEGPDADFIVYEFVEGHTLRMELPGGRFSTGDLVAAGIQLAEALSAAHNQGIAHRDLKPENIMVMPAEDSRGRMKILDFGLARQFAQPLGAAERSTPATTVWAETAPGVIAGTLAYMAPEQLEGEPADARTDIHALGVVLYEMVTLCHPFRGRSTSVTIANILTQAAAPITDHAPAAPTEINRIIHKCLRKRREERYQSARELLTDLRNFRSDSGSSTEAAAREQSPSLLRSFLGSEGIKPYRLWEIMHMKMCIRSGLLVILAWWFRTGSSGTASSILFFSTVVCATVYCLLSAGILYLGAGDRRSLCAYMRTLAPWFVVFGLASGVQALCMAALAAESHRMLALLLAVLGVAMGVTAVTFKPTLDRVAIYDPQ